MAQLALQPLQPLQPLMKAPSVIAVRPETYGSGHKIDWSATRPRFIVACAIFVSVPGG